LHPSFGSPSLHNYKIAPNGCASLTRAFWYFHSPNLPVVIPLLNAKERFAGRAKMNVESPGQRLRNFRYRLLAAAAGNSYPADVLVSDFYWFHHGSAVSFCTPNNYRMSIRGLAQWNWQLMKQRRPRSCD
jgi:hypothetical protein